MVKELNGPDRQPGGHGLTLVPQPQHRRHTMRAVVQHGYGGPEVLGVEEVPLPSPGARQVLVQVHAAGVDRGTDHLMTGKPYAARLALGLRRPRQPVAGRDVAGTVVAVGAEVTGYAVGDEVYGVAPGSFAEYAVGPEAKLAPKPAGLPFAEAAAVPISGGTALQALAAGRVRAGQSVLVLGASGGVGSFAVQLAKAAGAEVTGVCGTAKQEFVRSIGADHVLDHTRSDFADGTRQWDVILDIGGSPSLQRLRRALKPGGTVVFVGGEGGGNVTGLGRQLRGALLSPLRKQRMVLLVAKERASDYERLAELIGEGSVAPRVDRSYPLEEAAEALRRLRAGDVQGKLVLTVVPAG